jgi:hypothetical protein
MTGLAVQNIQEGTARTGQTRQDCQVATGQSGHHLVKKNLKNSIRLQGFFLPGAKFTLKIFFVPYNKNSHCMYNS